MHCFVSKDARSSAPWLPPHTQKHIHTRTQTLPAPPPPETQLLKTIYRRLLPPFDSWCCVTIYLSIPPEPFTRQSHKRKVSDFIISRHKRSDTLWLWFHIWANTSPLPCWFSPLCVWGVLWSGWEHHSWAPPGSVHPCQSLCSQQPWGQRSGCTEERFLRNIVKYMSSKAYPGGASWYLNFDLLMTQQRNQMWDDAGVDDHLYLLVPSIGQIRQSPHRVHQDLQETKKSHRFFSAAWTN